MPKGRRVADGAPGLSPELAKRMETKGAKAQPPKAGTPRNGGAVPTSPPSRPPAGPPVLIRNREGKRPVISMGQLTDMTSLMRGYELTCPKCRFEFETEPMLRPEPARVTLCPNPAKPKCEHFGGFDSFVNPGPEPEVTTIGDFIVCTALVDRAKEGQTANLQVCNWRYQNRIRGTGPQRNQNGISGQYVGCPKCGALDRRVPRATHDLVEDEKGKEWDAHDLNALAAQREKK